MRKTATNQAAAATDAVKTAAITDNVKTAVQQTLQQASVSITAQVPQQFVTLAAVRQARVNLLQRQAAALATQPGTNAADVAALQTSIQLHQSSIAKFGAVSNQASTPAPSIPANGWVLHGRVRDAHLQPVAKFTVTLTDREKAWQRQYGYAFTDASGYFMLVYAPPAAAPCPAPTETAQPVTRPARQRSAKQSATKEAEAAVVAGPPSTPTDVTRSLTDSAPAETTQAVAPLNTYLQVLNDAGEPVYFDLQAFTLTPGVVLYRNVVLADTKPLGNPPTGAVVVPPPTS